MNRQQEKWIDNIKLFACVLVALGHFSMSMVESGILPDTNLYKWFVRTIYYFHVPLFFMCSGYLYQKNSNIKTIRSWKNNVLKKAVALGIPYFAFSIATWLLKSIFSGAVNTQNDELLVTLFTKPSSPYWYLYTLFFLFVITPTFVSKKNALLALMIAVLLKYVRAANFFTTDIYAITQTFDNLIWFVSGMCMSVFHIPYLCKNRTWKKTGLFCAGAFFAASCIDLSGLFHSVSIKLIMGFLGCLTVFLIILNWASIGTSENISNILSRYTMPVYLMHTIFAAGIRAVLLKLGITDSFVHVVLGLIASFAGPVLAAEVMKKLKLDFLYNPSKYIRFPKPIKE